MRPAAATRSGFERRLRLLGDRLERGRLVDCELGEDLAVELDVRLLAAVDELVVGEALLPRGRVDARDPEAAEDALLVLAVAVGVDERVLDLLLRVGVRGVLEPPVATCLLEDLAPLLAGVDGSFYARHLAQPFPSSFLTFGMSALATGMSLSKS